MIVSVTRRWVFLPATTISLLTVPTLTSCHVHSAAIISYLDAFLKHSSKLRFHCQSLEKDLKRVFTASAISCASGVVVTGKILGVFKKIEVR